MISKLFRILTVLWAGSLWSTIWVALTLFHAQPDKHLAGVLAVRLFAIETYVGLGWAAVALLIPGERLLPNKRRFAGGYVAAGLLTVNEWLLRPVMEAARLHGTAAGLGFGAWHGVSALLYLVACLAVLVLVWSKA